MGQVARVTDSIGGPWDVRIADIFSNVKGNNPATCVKIIFKLILNN
jgi:hypothetical protein